MKLSIEVDQKAVIASGHEAPNRTVECEIPLGSIIAAGIPAAALGEAYEPSTGQLRFGNGNVKPKIRSGDPEQPDTVIATIVAAYQQALRLEEEAKARFQEYCRQQEAEQAESDRRRAEREEYDRQVLADRRTRVVAATRLPSGYDGVLYEPAWHGHYTMFDGTTVSRSPEAIAWAAELSQPLADHERERKEAHERERKEAQEAQEAQLLVWLGDLAEQYRDGSLSTDIVFGVIAANLGLPASEEWHDEEHGDLEKPETVDPAVYAHYQNVKTKLAENRVDAERDHWVPDGYRLDISFGSHHFDRLFRLNQPE